MICFTVTSCASAYKSTNVEHYNSETYQNKEVVTESLFGKDEKDMSEEQIQKLLNSRIKIGQNIKIAVYKLKSKTSSRSFYHAYSEREDIQELSNSILNDFFEKLEKSDRISDVSIMPSLLAPEEFNINSIRKSAVRLQPDFLLIYKPRNYTDYEFNLFEKSKAKTSSTVEALLIDMKTGVIPFTSVITSSSTVTKENKDWSQAEVFIRSKIQSEGLALIQIGNDLLKFINSSKN